jgi:hypothetical protein
MVSASSGWKAGALAAIFALGLSVAGCATDSLQKQDDLAQRVADADTRAEHLDLAVWYEQEARTAKERVAYHQRMERLYEALRDRPAKGALQMAPYVDYKQRTDAAAATAVELCKSQVRAAEEAVEAYLTFAGLHRQMATASME